MKPVIFIFFACLLQGVIFGSVQEEGRVDSSAIQQARDKVLAQGDYQTELPNRLREFKSSESSSSDSWLRDFVPSIDLVIRIILGIMAGVVLVAFVRFVLDHVQERKRDMGREARSGAMPIKAGDFQIDLGEIRDLAARGHHGEAIHLLLLKTVQELCRLTNVEISPAKTSREITREIPLEDSPQDDLEALVLTTEISHFGEVPATAADFESCMRRFESFVTNLGGKIS